jgi:hypothetical protein
MDDKVKSQDPLEQWTRESIEQSIYDDHKHVMSITMKAYTYFLRYLPDVNLKLPYNLAIFDK